MLSNVSLQLNMGKWWLFFSTLGLETQEQIKLVNYSKLKWIWVIVLKADLAARI